MAAALSQIASVTVMIAVILWLLLSRNGSESELAHSFRRAACGGADWGDPLFGGLSLGQTPRGAPRRGRPGYRGQPRPTVPPPHANPPHPPRPRPRSGR